MKLLVVLSITEYQEQVASLLQKAGISKFSSVDITGYKKREESLSWFGSNSVNAKTNSLMLFCFTTKEIANKAIEDINSCNLETAKSYPVHAFVLDVENFSKLL